MTAGKALNVEVNDVVKTESTRDEVLKRKSYEVPEEVPIDEDELKLFEVNNKNKIKQKNIALKKILSKKKSSIEKLRIQARDRCRHLVDSGHFLIFLDGN